MFDLLVATTNPGKIREIRLALAGAPVRLLTLDDVEPGGEHANTAPEETGATFAENAALKARHYGAAFGIATVAEDSGLVIDTLGGRPGVESARYPGATYADKFANLYRELSSHPRPWTARFVCALALVGAPRGDAVLFATSASVSGEIAPQPRGTRGFGYDPILFYPPLGCTLGETTDSQKLAVSHRGRAFREFRRWLVDGAGSHLAL
jgi:XTP/dITP diphosphohydrolase